MTFVKILDHSSRQTKKRRQGKNNSLTIQMTDIKALKEQKAVKLTKITGNPEIARLFIISMIISFILIAIGFLLVLANINSLSILLGLFMLIIGIIQTIIDFGWVGMIKINHEDSISSWKDAFYTVSKIRGQKIFIIPIGVDFFLILLSIISLLV